MENYTLTYCDQDGTMRKRVFTDQNEATEAYNRLQCPYKLLVHVSVQVTKLFEKNSVNSTNIP